MIELMKKRRSIRTFTEEKVRPEHIEKILEAALLAPSSRNLRPLKFIVLEDKETITKLAACKNSGTKALETAPAAIVVIGNTQKSDVWIEDGAIAATYIFLEAEQLGLGANWIQFRLRQGTVQSSDQEVKELLGIPDHYQVLAAVAFGYKGEEKPGYTESDLDRGQICMGQYTK